MLNLAQGVRIWLAVAPCDMRKQMDSLLTLVAGTHGQQAAPGNIYVFLSRRRNYARLLFIDASGICVFSKRFFDGSIGSQWATGLDLSGETLEIPSVVLAEILSGGRQRLRDFAA